MTTLAGENTESVLFDLAIIDSEYGGRRSFGKQILQRGKGGETNRSRSDDLPIFLFEVRRANSVHGHRRCTLYGLARAVFRKTSSAEKCRGVDPEG